MRGEYGSWDDYWYREVVGEAYDRMGRFEETPVDTIRFLVDVRGIDLETARRATEEARQALRQVRGYG